MVLWGDSVSYTTVTIGIPDFFLASHLCFMVACSQRGWTVLSLSSRIALINLGPILIYKLNMFDKDK